MIEALTPNVIAPPIGRYPHLVRVTGPGEWLFISGQVGLDLDGVMPPDIYHQTLNVFDNIERLLASVDSDPRSIVRLLTFIVGAESMHDFARARDEVYARWFPGGAIPGHSLAVAEALARPDVLIELEGWAYVTANGAIGDAAQR